MAKKDFSGNARNFGLAEKKKSDSLPREIRVELIDENELNDTIYDNDPVELEKLKNDIESVGLIQPITVRKHPMFTDRYVLIAGHRRLKVFKMLGHEKIPALVIKIKNDADEIKADIMLLTSNINVRPRSVTERAREAKLLKERILEYKKVSGETYKGNTDDIVAELIDKSPSYVRQLVRIDNADENVKELLNDEKINVGEALKLNSMDIEQKDEIINKINTADTSEQVKQIKKTEINRPKQKAAPAEVVPAVGKPKTDKTNDVKNSNYVIEHCLKNIESWLPMLSKELKKEGVIFPTERLTAIRKEIDKMLEDK